MKVELVEVGMQISAVPGGPVMTVTRPVDRLSTGIRVWYSMPGRAEACVIRPRGTEVFPAGVAAVRDVLAAEVVSASWDSVDLDSLGEIVGFLTDHWCEGVTITVTEGGAK